MRVSLFILGYFFMQGLAAPTEAQWNAHTKKHLDHIIQVGAGQKKVAIFDFDNTILCRDIGRATLGVLIRDGKITPASIEAIGTPSFIKSESGTLLTPQNGILQFYTHLLKATTSHPEEACSDIGYGWAVQILRGLHLQDILQATAHAYQNDLASQDLRQMKTTKIEVPNEATHLDAPFFYPEMVELIGTLLQKDYQVWIMSASNIWSVRWLVLHGLNPKLKELGVQRLIPAENVVGIATILQNSDSTLLHDEHLLKNPEYAQLNEGDFFTTLTLTSLLIFPVPSYTGKVANILKRIQNLTPYLIAGDSQNDFAMLKQAEHPLLIARIDQPQILEDAKKLIEANSLNKHWMIQPTLTQQYAGFFDLPKNLPPEILGTNLIQKSLSILKNLVPKIFETDCDESSLDQ